MCAQDNSLHPLSDFKTSLMLSLRGSRKEKETCSDFMQKEIRLSPKRFHFNQLISKISQYAIFDGGEDVIKM